MSSPAPVQRSNYAAMDLNAFDPLPAEFRLGTIEASR
jgi:hypothetical protein